MIINNNHLNQWNEYLELKEYSERTKELYGLYAKGLKGTDITQQTINRLIINKGNNYRPFLKVFFKCLKINDVEIIQRGGRSKEHMPDFFTRDEMKAIFDSVSELRLHLLIRLMYENGLRISEAMNLTPESFDLINKRVKGKGKGNREFNLPLFSDTPEILKIYLENFDKGDHVFWWNENQQSIKAQRLKALRVVKKAVMNALPYKPSNEVYNHAFRHSRGTHLAQKGWNLLKIARFLRHKDLSTVKWYVAVDERGMYKEAEEALK